MSPSSIFQASGFAKRHRLLNGAQYARVLSSRNRGASGCFRWYACVNDLSYPRLGIAVPKRWVKLAVRRNKFKRLIRESFRHHKHEMNGCDVVVMLSRPVTATSSTELLAQLRKIWPQAGAVAPCAGGSGY